jgi:hypothetical protein
MGYYLDLAAQLIVHPRLALRAITRGEQWGAAGIFWLFTILLLSMSSFVEGVGIFLGFLLCFLLCFTGLMLHGAIVHYAAGLLGGRGSARGLTAGFMASTFPAAFTVFASLAETLGIPFVSGVIGLFTLIWCFVLDVIVVSENYGLSTGRAVLVLMMPYVAVAILALGFFGLSMAVSLAALFSMTM